MNRVLVNGAAFNGRALAGVLFASAVLTGSAGVAAVGAYHRSASVVLLGVSTTQAAATRVKPGTVQPLAASAALVVRATNRQSSRASLTGAATVRAGVRRNVLGYTNFTGQSGVVAFVASKLGEVRSQATSGLLASPTRRPYALSRAEGAAALTGESTVVRGVLSGISGVAQLYAEEGQRYCVTLPGGSVVCYAVYRARALPVAEAQLISAGTRRVLPTAGILGTVDVRATGAATRNIHQFGEVGTSSTATLSATETKTTHTQVALPAAAGVVTTATRVIQSRALPQARVSLSVSASARSVVSASLLGVASVTADMGRVRSASARILAPATTAVTGVRRLLPIASTTGTANLRVAVQAALRLGTADAVAQAAVTASGRRLALGVAPVRGEALLTPAGIRWARGSALMAGLANVSADSARRATAAGDLRSSATLRGAPHLNIEALDPSTIVLVRPANETDFVRPLGETDFVRSI